MAKVQFPYGKSYLEYDIPDNRYLGTLVSKLHEFKPSMSESEMVLEALRNPIGTKPLHELSKGKKNIVIIASDHTRPVPSKIIAPLMLSEIRRGNPSANILFLISTGCHRETTKQELVEKFGEDIVNNENILIHDCDDNSMMVNLGLLPSGGELIINKLAYEADLTISEGFIEPHFFAGFSGGRKSILPGIASRKTVIYNHNAQFINDPHSRTGILDNNPIHRDMLYAAKRAGLDFICNVVINQDKKIMHAVAGDLDLAHQNGCEFLNKYCKVDKKIADIVITSNSGYPLDQNVYQSVKGMTAAEANVTDEGIIIMLAKSNDGHGGESFYNTFKNEPDLDILMKEFLSTPADKTIIDQWQSQIFARILMKATVIFISDADDQIIKDLHMIPAHAIDEAVKIADSILAKKGITNGSILAIPDGVSVIVK